MNQPNSYEEKDPALTYDPASTLLEEEVKRNDIYLQTGQDLTGQDPNMMQQPGGSPDASGGQQAPQQQQGDQQFQGAFADEKAKLAAQNPNDSRLNDTFEFSDITNEIGSALAGGGMDTVNSATTFVPRAMDMLQGKPVGEEGYTPAGMVFDADVNPVNTTWAGNFARMGVHYASSAVLIAAALKAAVFAGIPGAGVLAAGGGLTALSKANKGKKGVELVRKALAAQRKLEKAAKAGSKGAKMKLLAMKGGQSFVHGAGVDTMSIYSQEDNVTGALKERMPWLDGPLATQDQDSPLVKTAKNILEGGPGGMIADTLIAVLGRGARSAKNAVFGGADPDKALDALKRIEHRNNSVSTKNDEMGVEQTKSPDYGGYKSDSDQHQGASNSSPYNGLDGALEGRKRYDAEPDKQLASMDDLTTPAQLKRADDWVGMSPAQTKKWYKDTFGMETFDSLVKSLRALGRDPDEVFSIATEGVRKMMDPQGNLRDMSVEDFRKEILGDATSKIDDEGNFHLIAPEKIVQLDLLNSMNLALIKDRALAGSSLREVLDPMATDGPMSVIKDRLEFGITENKTARWLWSEYGRRLRTPEGREAAAKAYAKKKAEFKAQARDGTAAMMQILDRAPDNDLVYAALEAFSFSTEYRHLDDLWKYFDNKLKGGNINGKVATGQVIRELQGVMVNSVLSGPKTPIRALMGTSIAAYTRPMAQILGATMTGDKKGQRQAIAALTAMREAIPEAFKLGKMKMNALLQNNLQTDVKGFQWNKDDQAWMQMEAQRKFRKDMGEKWSVGDEMAFQITRIARGWNSNSLFTLGTKLMQSTDTALAYIMYRGRIRQKAMEAALDGQPGAVKIDKKVLADFEDKFAAELMDAEGNIKWDSDAALKFAKEEATLTRDVSGFAGALTQAMDKAPMLKPFFLFARTGINGIELSFKHMPLLNRLVADEKKILNATAKQADAGELMDVGISNARELDYAKQISMGRQMIGVGVVTAASMAFLDGRITGNGPQNRKQRQLMLDNGWKPRSIKVGNVWVGYDALEPFNTILAFVADTGHYYEQMGEEWTEKNLFKAALIVGQGITQKSYLAGAQQVVDLLNMQPYQLEKIGANLLNNTIPMSSMRNELGKVFNPYMKELNAGMFQQLRNRNQLSELLAGEGEELPIKYDMLTGKPLNNWNFLQRSFNAIFPIPLSLDYSPGKQFLFDSGYDLRMTAYSNPDGIDLDDYPEVRSEYMQLIGKQNLEAKFAEIAKRPEIKRSMEIMKNAWLAGDVDYDISKSKHNDVIRKTILEAQRRAWGQLKLQNEKVQQLVKAGQMQNSADSFRRNNDEENVIKQRERAEQLIRMIK